MKQPDVHVLEIDIPEEGTSEDSVSSGSLADAEASSGSDDTVILTPSPRQLKQGEERRLAQMVEDILKGSPGGDKIMNEYARTKYLSDSRRRDLVKILVAHMTNEHGTSPPRHVKEDYALGIISLFPYLADPRSKLGYEHYYNAEDGSGYLAWRIKTLQKEASEGRVKHPRPSQAGDLAVFGQAGLCSGKSLKLKCGHRGCSHVYHSFSGLRKHLSKCCTNDNLNVDDGECSTSTNFISSEETDLPDQSSPSEPVLLERHIAKNCANIVAELKRVGNPVTTIDLTVSTVQEVIGDLDRLKQVQLKNSLDLQEPMKSVVESKIDQCFENALDPFLPLNTESKRMKYFSEKWGKIDPVEYVLGTRFATRFIRTSGGYGQTIVKDKFMYIPILETVKSIYQHPAINYMMARDPKQMENLLYDIQDGEFFKEHDLFSKQVHTVQLQLFFDEMECANPTGSKRGIHKLGAIYFTLRNVSPKYNSSLLNIHLVSLFHAQDIKTYGFHKILAPLVKDISTLETQGIQLPQFDHPIYGTIIQVTGDNLGLHSLFGFVESFSARYCCRFC